MQPVFRFAPSPNGYLHRGHAASALLNQAFAREMGGRLLLRVEDIDPQRSRPAYEAALLEDLAWLGLTWETPVRRQSRRMEAYASALAPLRQEGLLYPCFCSRAGTARHVAEAEAAGRSWPLDPDGAPHHAGPCAGLPPAEAAARVAAGEPHAWRLRMAEAVRRLPMVPAAVAFDGEGRETVTTPDPLAWGDVVLARRDVPTSYHLAVVVDDADQGVTHVVRGQDLAEATAVHRVLQELLGLPAPRYHHHPLVLDAEGRKLAKSRQSLPLRDLRAQGVTAADVRRGLGF